MTKLLTSDETLFRNEDVFDLDYVPETFAYRDNEMQMLASLLRPAMRGSRPVNAFITGLPATGKTTAIRKLMEQLKDTMSNIVICHVNCKTYKSGFRIFSEIHRSVFGFIPPDTGIPFTTLYDKIFGRLEKDKKILLVVLDEMNELDDGDDVLYNILRASESFNVRTGVWGISTISDLHKLQDKTRSVYHPETLLFRPYTLEQIKRILMDRIQAGLYPGTMPVDVLDEIAELTSQRRDLRFGIEMLRRAVMNAENQGLRSVTMEHVPKNAKDNDEKDDYSIIVKMIGNGTDSGELYEKVKDKMSYSSFRRLLVQMEKKGVITRKEITKGKGKTSEITLN